MQGSLYSRRHVSVLIRMLKDTDALVQQNAVSLLYAISGPSNWQTISEGMLEMLRRCPTFPLETALKVLMLVELYTSDLKRWDHEGIDYSYVDIVFRTCEAIPDSLTDDIWFRMVQVVTGFDGDSADLKWIQSYSAMKAFNVLKTTENNVRRVQPVLLFFPDNCPPLLFLALRVWLSHQTLIWRNGEM